jgi:diacylglycerol kinase (ATP)
MHVAIIGNPIAGTGGAVDGIRRLEARLSELGCRVTTRWTGEPGDTTAPARNLEGAADCLIVAGGDGTIHQILNSLRDPGRTPLAILPVGTANILARDLGLPRQIEEAARMVLAGKVRKIDMGTIAPGRRFMMVASCGFDAMVIRALHARRRGTLGARRYPLAILETLMNYTVPTLRVSVDGKPPVVGAMVVVANTPTYAGIMSVADRARLDSAHLDVVVIRFGSITALTRYAWMSWRKRLSKLPDVAYLTGTSVRVESDMPVDVEVDGECSGHTPVEIGLKPAAVPLVVP